MGTPIDTLKALRLLRRRREWAWTAGGSLMGLVAYVILGASFFQDLTGTLAVISVIPVFVLLALIPAGLIAVTVDTVRLRRLDPAVRASAAGVLFDAALDGRPPRYRLHGCRAGWCSAASCSPRSHTCPGRWTRWPTWPRPAAGARSSPRHTVRSAVRTAVPRSLTASWRKLARTSPGLAR